MATQSPTRPSLQRRPLWPVAVIGLAALLWSCESEQVGYQVAIPLIGPMEFDESSCEISEDVCSTDEDCVDEDGLFVGPCTKTMDNLEPITVLVSLSSGNPSYTLGVPDTSQWDSILAAQQAGSEGVELDMSMDDFSIQGGPVTLSVRVFSRVGLISGQPATYEPVTPSSCTFTLDDSSTGQDYADGINTCLSDWISENGAPVEFDIEVTSSAGAASSALAAKSGFGPKQTDYNLDGTYNLSTNKDCDTQNEQDVLEPIREGEGFFELISCEGLTLTGNGSNVQELDELSGKVEVWDRCGNYAKAILDPTELPANGEWQVEVDETGEVSSTSSLIVVTFTPAGVDFAKALVSAATGACFEDAPLVDPIREEKAIAGWHHCGPEPPPDRMGQIIVTTEGFCSVAEDSDGTGATGGSTE